MFLGMNGYDWSILLCLIFFVVLLILSIGFLFTPRYKLEKNKFFRNGVRIIVPYAANLCFYGSTLSALLKHNNERFRIENIYQLLFSTVEGFKFELRKELFIPEYIDKHILYNISGGLANIVNSEGFSLAMLILYLISLLLFYSTAVTILFDSLRNIINVRHKFYKGADIVLGNLNYEDYVKDYNDTVIWLDPRYDSDKLEAVKKSGIPYINREFNCDKLIARLFWANNIKIVVIGDEERALEAITEFNDFYKIKSEKKYSFKDYELIAEVSYGHLPTIQDSIRKGEYPDSVRVFNRYELLSINFNTKYPIARSLPIDLYEDIENNIEGSKNTAADTSINDNYKNCISVVKNEAEINVIYIGFGKVNKAIHDISAMNDILPTLVEKNGKYNLRNKKINYYAYDRCFDNVDLANKSKQNYRDFIKGNPDINSYYNLVDLNDADTLKYIYYSEKNNKITAKEHKNGDASTRTIEVQSASESSNSTDLISSKLKEIMDKPNSFTRIIVSLNNGLDNVNDSHNLIEFIKKNKFKNVEIMVRVKKYDANVYKLFGKKDAVLFGVDSNVLNHSSIINGKIYNTSKSLEGRYASSKLNTNEWLYKSRANDASNFYKTLNTRTKLNLLGFDLNLDKDVDVADSTLSMSKFIADNRYKEILSINDRLGKNREFIKNSGIYQLIFADQILSKNGRLYRGRRLAASIEGFMDDYSKINFSILNKDEKPKYYNVLGYQEHSRWNAFKLINDGTIPYPKEDKYFYLPSEFQCKKDSSDPNRHSCLTDFDDLYYYHHDLKDLMLNGVSSYASVDITRAEAKILKSIEGKLGISLEKNKNGGLAKTNGLYKITIVNSSKLKKFIIENKGKRPTPDFVRFIKNKFDCAVAFYRRKNKHTFLRGLCIPFDILFFLIGLVLHGIKVLFAETFNRLISCEGLNRNLYECIINPNDYIHFSFRMEKRIIRKIKAIFKKLNRARKDKSFVYKDLIIYFDDKVATNKQSEIKENDLNYELKTPLARDLYIFIEKNINMALYGVKKEYEKAMENNPYLAKLYKADEYYQRAYALASPEFYMKVKEEVKEYDKLKNPMAYGAKVDFSSSYGSKIEIKENNKLIAKAKKKIQKLMDIKYSSNPKKKKMMEVQLKDKPIAVEDINAAAKQIGLSVANRRVKKISDNVLYTKLIESDGFIYLAYVIDNSIMSEADLHDEVLAKEKILKLFRKPNRRAKAILYEIVKAIASNNNMLFNPIAASNIDEIVLYEQAILAQVDTFRYDYTLPTTIRDLCDKIELCRLDYKKY